MPKISPAQEQLRRTQILDAANACFARQGYRATSMDDIVRESGLSVGAIYTYFPSKEDLFLALADTRMQESLTYLTALFDQPGPMDAKMRAAVDYFFHLLDSEFATHARISLEFWSEAPRSERLKAREAARCAELTHFLSDLFAEAQQRGDMRSDFDPEIAAMMVSALSDGILMRHVLGMHQQPLSELKAAFVEFVNHGLSDPHGSLFKAHTLPAAGDCRGARTFQEVPA